MPRATPLQPSLNAGEFSPRMVARTDFAKYPLGCATLENMIPLPQGGAMRRPGTVFVAEVKDSTKKPRLIPFEFSTVQAYIIECGDLYFRFYKDRGRIESPPGTPVEIATVYTEAELPALKYAQSADTLYICHPSHAVHKLTRSSHTSWTIAEVDFTDGPYLDQHTTATTLTPSATTGGGITITASAVTGINGGSGFLSSDVGRYVRIDNPASGTQWGYAKITAVGSTTSVTADVKRDFATTNATANWRLGAWSGTTGYPSAVAFFEQRLAFAASTDQPQTLWLSQSADFENMQPDDGKGAVADDDALDFTVSADQVNAIRWLAPGKNLFLGTIGGEWQVKSNGPLITPTDIDVKRQTTFGSADIAPAQMRGRLLFVQRAARKVLEFTFSFDIDQFLALDMTLLANHVTKGGITEMAYQQEPDSTLWCVRADGQLAALTYQPDQQVVGWARYIAGGTFGSGDAVVESVGVIPGSGQDELWVACKRTVNGTTRRYIEYYAAPFETGDDEKLACYSDSALLYNGAAATTFTGLDHLEGESVSILADGAIHPNRTVTSGQITLDYAAAKVVVGLGYTHTYESLKWEAGAPAGTAQGQTKRISGVTLMLLDAATSSIGPDTANLKALNFRDVDDPMDTAVPLFTGEKFVEFEGDFATDTRVVVRGSDPAPFTLLAIAPEIKTNPR